jgi:hypothetical protein
MRDTLKVDRTAQDFRDLLDQVSYGETHKEPRKRDREEDDDSTRLLSPTPRKKSAGGGPNEAPPLSGPTPCYGWILRRCPGAVCTVAKNRRRGPNPHEWDAADDGTPAAKAFEKWVKANKRRLEEELTLGVGDRRRALCPPGGVVFVSAGTLQ